MTTVPPYADWIPSTPPLSDEDLRSSFLTVVHYWAIWNHRNDAEMDRRVAALRPDYESRIRFRSCDTDKPENARFLKDICNIPTLGSYFRGSQYKVKVGLRSEAELRQVLDEWLAEAGSRSAGSANVRP